MHVQLTSVAERRHTQRRQVGQVVELLLLELLCLRKLLFRFLLEKGKRLSDQRHKQSACFDTLELLRVI